MILGQTFDPTDLGTIGLLVLLEGVLSVDNALVLGALAGRVAPPLQSKALRYGLIGAILFRVIAVLLASFLLRWQALKLIGAVYLIYLAAHHFFSTGKTALPGVRTRRPPFWWSVIGIELTDLAFAVDNVLAAVALVGSPPPGWPAARPHPKLWVILTGGLMGVVLMRFAAVLCVKLLQRFPRMEASAYVIVFLVACKLGLEWAGLDFQQANRPQFWLFWCMMAVCLAVGLIPPRRAGVGSSVAIPPISAVPSVGREQPPL